MTIDELSKRIISQQYDHGVPVDQTCMRLLEEGEDIKDILKALDSLGFKMRGLRRYLK